MIQFRNDENNITYCYQCSVNQVWEALTKPELVKKWQYNTDLTTDWKQGSSLIFKNEIDGSTYEQKGTVLEIDKPTYLKYSLFAPRPGLEDKPENYFTMIYTLEEKDQKTTLAIIQEDPRGQMQEEQSEESENSVLQALKTLIESSQK